MSFSLQCIQAYFRGKYVDYYHRVIWEFSGTSALSVFQLSAIVRWQMPHKLNTSHLTSLLHKHKILHFDNIMFFIIQPFLLLFF